MGKTGSWRLGWRWLLALALAGSLLLIYVRLSHSPQLPVYQGKNLYVWAAELQEAQQWRTGQDYSDPRRWKKIDAATAAIRAMGTNAMPFVMADILATPTIKDSVVSWLASHAHFLKLQPGKLEDHWVRGIRVLEVLGPLGKPYLPQLVTLVSNSTGYAESALLAVGPGALPAFTNFLAVSKFPQTGNLIGALANAVFAERIQPEQAAVALPYLVKVFRSSDMHGRWYAAGALGAIHKQPELCVPLLVQGLTNSTPNIRESCVESLGRFGEAASSHAGELADVFDQADPQTRRAICGALGSFHSAGPIAVPVLVRALSDPDESVRNWAATGLGQLATLPEQAVPALVKALEDRNYIVRIMAVQSLGQIGPPATNAMPAIQRACLDPQVSVRNAATNALIRLRR